jgi:hypothetical protein
VDYYGRAQGKVTFARHRPNQEFKVWRHQRNKSTCRADCPKRTKRTASNVDRSWILHIQPTTTTTTMSIPSPEEMHQVETIVSGLTRDRQEAVVTFGSSYVPVCLSELYPHYSNRQCPVLRSRIASAASSCKILNTTSVWCAPDEYSRVRPPTLDVQREQRDLWLR